MENNEPKTCAHPACICTVTTDDKYCSDRCKDGGDGIEISCDCGHPGCSIAE